MTTPRPSAAQLRDLRLRVLRVVASQGFTTSAFVTRVLAREYGVASDDERTSCYVMGEFWRLRGDGLLRRDEDFGGWWHVTAAGRAAIVASEEGAQP